MKRRFANANDRCLGQAARRVQSRVIKTGNHMSINALCFSVGNTLQQPRHQLLTQQHQQPMQPLQPLTQPLQKPKKCTTRSACKQYGTAASCHAPP